MTVEQSGWIFSKHQEWQKYEVFRSHSNKRLHGHYVDNRTNVFLISPVELNGKPATPSPSRKSLWWQARVVNRAPGLPHHRQETYRHATHGPPSSFLISLGKDLCCTHQGANMAEWVGFRFQTSLLLLETSPNNVKKGAYSSMQLKLQNSVKDQKPTSGVWHLVQLDPVLCCRVKANREPKILALLQSHWVFLHNSDINSVVRASRSFIFVLQKSKTIWEDLST